jgi:2-isopropylmalate synthase
MSQFVKIFDTTLRDGEQSPGFSMNVAEKIRVAKRLERMGVDVIEAGFPVASQGDFEAVQAISAELKETIVAGLARANSADVDRAWQAIQKAPTPRIHTFISSSDIHLEHQLKLSRTDVLNLAVSAVKQAKTYTDDVEFSAMDATRSDREFLAQMIGEAIDAGATTVNIPSSVSSSSISWRTCRTYRRRWSAFTVTTTSAWPWPIPWRQCGTEPDRWNAL